MGITLQIIAGVLAAARPEAAAMILGAAEAYVIESAMVAQLIGARLTAALGDERAGELRARGAGTDWDLAHAYTLAQIGQALNEPESGSQS